MPTLAKAALDEVEREFVDRFVAAVRDEYGADLHGIWLYGSRARGERAHDESDVDLLVVTHGKHDDGPLIDLQWRIIEDMGNPSLFIDPRQGTLAWVEDRRAIRSFFLQEVDRDKIVLLGGP